MQVSSFYVYLGAACLPLNVLENQTRARSSVPAKQRGGMVHGISCALESTLKKGKPAIPIGTLLALANSIFPPTRPEEGSRGRGRKGPATGTPAFFFSFPGTQS